MKLIRHNGRAGKNGTYNPKHNDRNFNIHNSEHIDETQAEKISTGTVTMVTETLFMIIKQTNWQIHLKKWSNTFMLPNTKTL